MVFARNMKSDTTSVPLIICVSSSKEARGFLTKWCDGFPGFEIVSCDFDSLKELATASVPVPLLVLDFSGQPPDARQQFSAALLGEYLELFPQSRIVGILSREESAKEQVGKVQASGRAILFKYPIAPQELQVAMADALTSFEFDYQAASGAKLVTHLIGQVEIEVTRMLGLIHELGARDSLQSLRLRSGTNDRIPIHRLAALNRSKKLLLGTFSEDPYWSIIVEVYLAELLNKPNDFKSIALNLAIPLATFTRRITAMERGKVLIRQPDGKDKRRFRLNLTENIRKIMYILLGGN
jgi:DNA-binding MarR family transcriptional regulator